jgi:hypothetical protein
VESHAGTDVRRTRSQKTEIRVKSQTRHLKAGAPPSLSDCYSCS